MENKELLKMITIYKNKLADVEEQNVIYQALLSKEKENNAILTKEIEFLETKINEENVPSVEVEVIEPKGV